MDISGGAAPAGAQYQVAVLQEQQSSVREEGKQALKLIETSAGPAPNHSAGDGSTLNIVA